MLARIALGAIMVLAPAPVAAKEISLEPISKWQVDSSTFSCRAVRAFGTADRPFVMAIEQFSPASTFQLSFIGDELAPFDQGERTMLRFGEGTKFDVTARIFPAKTGDGRHSAIIASTWMGESWSAPRTYAEAEAATTSVMLSFGPVTVRLNTGPMDKVFGVMRNCTSGLVQAWGFDPAQQASLTRYAEPETPPATWLKPEDYPSAPGIAPGQAILHVRLMIDEMGNLKDCTVLGGPAGPRFERETCAKLRQRVRFKPALDHAGRPIASYLVQSVVWAMR